MKGDWLSDRAERLKGGGTAENRARAEARRRKVATIANLGVGAYVIADAIGERRATVSRDLEMLRRDRKIAPAGRTGRLPGACKATIMTLCRLSVSKVEGARNG